MLNRAKFAFRPYQNKIKLSPKSLRVAVVSGLIYQEHLQQKSPIMLRRRTILSKNHKLPKFHFLCAKFITLWALFSGCTQQLCNNEKSVAVQLLNIACLWTVSFIWSVKLVCGGLRFASMLYVDLLICALLVRLHRFYMLWYFSVNIIIM